MAVLRGTSSGFNASTNTSTTHSVVFVERGVGFSGLVAADCLQQCKHIETIQDIGNTAPMTRTLLYFVCGSGNNSNGVDAAYYKSRTDKFNCDDSCMFINRRFLIVTVHEIQFSKYLYSER